MVFDIPPQAEYNGLVVKNAQEGIAVNENEAATKWEDRFSEEANQIANMDAYDFMTLLMESRIIQAS